MGHRKVWIVGAVVPLAFIFLWIVFGPTRMPLVITWSDPSVHVASVVCTVGTNHVYYWGDRMDRLMDPLITRLSDRNAYRLRCTTTNSNTVVWIRFDHPDYGVVPTQGPPVRPLAPFRAQLIDTNGAAVPLPDVNHRLQSYRRRFLVMGWEVAGQLEDHRGSTLRIETTSGTGAVTFKVP